MGMRRRRLGHLQLCKRRTPFLQLCEFPRPGPGRGKAAADAGAFGCIWDTGDSTYVPAKDKPGRLPWSKEPDITTLPMVAPILLDMDLIRTMYPKGSDRGLVSTLDC